MVKKLRHRFIAVTILSVFSTIALLTIIINGISYRNVVDRADWTLSILSANHGTFPESLLIKGRRGSVEVSGSGDVEEKSTIIVQKKRRFSKLNPKDDTSDRSYIFRIQLDNKARTSAQPFETRYFSVLTDSAGNLREVDSSQLLAVNKDALESIQRKAERKLSKDGKCTFIEDFRCTRVTEKSGTRYIYLDCSRSLDNFRAFRNVSILVCLIGVTIISALITFFSGKILRPVAESYEKQQRFITDAGHEIRTPLTIINADVSVLEMEQPDDAPNEWLEDIRQQTRRLSTLTEELVYLTRMEEVQKTSVNMKRLNFSKIVGDVAHSFESRALVSEKKYNYDVTDDLFLRGDESALRKLVSILLDNAFKYSSDSGDIRLNFYRQGKNIFLTVSNSVDEIQKESIPHFFDRFYRADSSRNSETGGHGIGLSIALAVVRAHGGKIAAYTPDGKSLRITATFPV